MPVSPLPLFVIVIDRARAGSRTRADECTFSTANQSSCTCTDGCTYADAFRGLLFSGLRISITSALAARNGNCDRKREHQKQN
jgi:hypothetical protein